MEEKGNPKNLNIRFSDEDWEVINTLCKLYGGMDKASMVRQSLRHILKTKPKFVVAPMMVSASESIATGEQVKVEVQPPDKP